MDEALALGRERLSEIDDPLEKLKGIVFAHLNRFFLMKW
jgi:hypothetical protein